MSSRRAAPQGRYPTATPRRVPHTGYIGAGGCLRAGLVAGLATGLTPRLVPRLMPRLVFNVLASAGQPAIEQRAQLGEAAHPVAVLGLVWPQPVAA